MTSAHDHTAPVRFPVLQGVLPITSASRLKSLPVSRFRTLPKVWAIPLYNMDRLNRYSPCSAPKAPVVGADSATGESKT